MAKFSQSMERLLSVASSLFTFSGSIVPGTILGIVMAYLSQGVGLINQFGAFGWIACGLVTFLLTSMSFALFAKTQLWRVERRHRARLDGEGLDFDPMARVYQNKRLYLRDLAPLGRKRVNGKKFINCEIIGPGTAIIGMNTDPSKRMSVMSDCNTYDVDCIEIDPSSQSNLAIGFWDCDFEGCNFYHMTLLFMGRSNDTLNWITPDFRQGNLLEAQEHEQQS
ncbi:hypothetical protein [Sphingobium sp. TKS]|uniref:hypothetical protein n=2 Tax=unclassified Sphingobium TaxID=2611147 RepID=UPI0007702881|nr:hypothetical protein [Sphingobium sp. TKS]AMK22577.1 hypothetical protein K426_08150 [Sphingobium sp. TKS]